MPVSTEEDFNLKRWITNGKLVKSVILFQDEKFSITQVFSYVTSFCKFSDNEVPSTNSNKRF